MNRNLAKALFIAYDNYTGRHTYALRKYLEKTQWMKKRDLQRLQLKRLRALLKHCYDNVPYYHESFIKANLRPQEIKSLEDLRKVPILKKRTIREKPHKMIAKNIPKKEFVPFSTGGTTAAPVKFYRGKADVGWGDAAELRACSWAGYEFGDKCVLIKRFKPEQIRNFKFRLKEFFRREKILNIYYLSEKSMALFARKMHRFKPVFFRAYSSAMNVFAIFILDNRRFRIRPKSIFTSAATLLPNYKKTIEEAFGCKVFDNYACNEVSHVAGQCGQNEGLHITEENVLLEIVKDDEPVSAGDKGRVLLTNLHSYAMPFIRYDVGDLGKIFDETCSCGRELSLMKPIGRTYEYFVSSDGSFTTLSDFQTVFEGLPIKEFQVVQQSCDEIIIKIVPRQGYTRKHTNFILNNIMQPRASGPTKIRVELVDSIPFGKSGKIRHIVSKIPTKYT